MSLGFPRDSRITRGPELQRVLKEGKRIRTKSFDVRACASPLGHSSGRRIGIIVPKAKHNAVERNLLKRQLKELARTMLLPAGAAMDIVLLARNDTYRAPFIVLADDMRRVTETLRVTGDDTR